MKWMKLKRKQKMLAKEIKNMVRFMKNSWAIQVLIAGTALMRMTEQNPKMKVEVLKIQKVQYEGLFIW